VAELVHGDRQDERNEARQLTARLPKLLPWPLIGSSPIDHRNKSTSTAKPPH
jgi:hypothetical protein